MGSTKGGSGYKHAQVERERGFNGAPGAPRVQSSRLASRPPTLLAENPNLDERLLRSKKGASCLFIA